MKKIWFLLYLIAILLTGCSHAENAKAAEEISPASEREELINLEGEWKVTEYIDSRLMIPDYSIQEHFLGRSIIIGPETIIRSLDYWPDEIRYGIDRYQVVEVETVSSYDSLFKGKNYIGEGWEKALGEQELTVLTYSMKSGIYTDYADRTFIITENGEVICQYVGNYYFMERYKEAETDLSAEKLIGDWQVKRLVSYQDGWRGNNSVLNVWTLNRTWKTVSEEQGAEFYPEEYLDNVVKVKETGIELYQENQLVERYEVEDYASLLMDKHDYQKEKGVHDGLGIANEEIQVFVGAGQIEAKKLLDGEIVVLNENEVIMKLYQGWYLLEKKG